MLRLAPQRLARAQHHIAHHNDGGAAQAACLHRLRQAAQRGHALALAGPGGALDHGGGRIGGQCAQQPGLYFGGMARAHVNDQRELQITHGLAHALPARGLLLRLVRLRMQMPAGKNHAVRALAMRERRAQAAQRRQSGSDAMHHARLVTSLAQLLHFFAAPAKNERIAPFEAHHRPPGARLAQHQRANARLRRAGLPAALAHAQHARARPRVGQHGFVNQVIHQKDIGAGNGLHGLEREQLRIARPRAHQRDAARRAWRGRHHA